MVDSTHLKNKILIFSELLFKVQQLKDEGKRIVQSHGVFDLIHPGTINHLKLAKQQGDILIVTVIKDKDVRRGPGRPIFTEELRVENVVALEMVDYACLVDDEVPFECIKRIRPHIFAKGQDHKERDSVIHRKIFEEEKEMYLGQCEIYETHGFSFSSSEIINNFLDIYPEEIRSFLKNFSNKYKFHNIVEELNKLKDLKVLLIGEGIIDEYHYCKPMHKSPKANLVVNKYLTHEIFAGGAFAIANHIAGLCDRVALVTLIGSENSREDFINENLKKNIDVKFFYRNDGPTIVKKRYIDLYYNQKLFEINHLNDAYISDEIERKVIEYLSSEIPKYDLVLVSDFGHGLITKRIVSIIESLSKNIAVNSQTNSANIGYNLITNYTNPNFACLDEAEARLSVQEKFADIEFIGKLLSGLLKTDYLIITLGKRGSIGFSSRNEIIYTPIFSTKVVDTVGAGDALFSYCALCFANGMAPDLISFIGNAVGALAVQIMGNKKPVEKYELFEFINALLK